jgi:hypothetical protein
MKIKKFNESFIDKYIKTPEEFEEIKNQMLKDIDDFIDKYDKFTGIVSPSHWRARTSL